jgi:DNA mismatch repair protein MutL
MGRIRVLPTELANQIAAGEVVERPASVVKELIENALDARATRIVVSAEFGGKKLVRVVDDGAGMEPDDAQLAIERHATSKIARADDLAAISTMGFRGEALPSIASVSHFVLRTRARGHVSGTEIRVNGGAVSSVTEIGAPEGTSVEIADLFYNLPARRKFLKSDAAESAQISRAVTQLALAHHGTGFVLVSGARTVLECPPVPTLRDRLFQLYGERSDLVQVARRVGGVNISGYIAALTQQGATRGPQNVFVNSRIVRDRTIAHAIIDAYSTASIRERSPEVHLFIDLPHEWVDVNVHPTKAEVRFRDQSLIHESVRRALIDALGQESAPAFNLTSATPEVPAVLNQQLPAVFDGTHASTWPMPGAGDPAVGRDAAPEHTGSSAPAVTTSGDAFIKPMVPLGQFRDTFIIAIDDEGVAIVDQHVAHERVLYERVMERLTRGRLESQGLLEPILIDLPAAGMEALAGHAGDLDRLGFDVEDFGGGQVRIVAMPAILDRAAVVATIHAMAADLEGLDRGSAAEDALKRIAALTACHAAVKANDPLSDEKMRHILDELRRTAHSTVCPHGRPVMLRLTRRQIEKNFERI